MRIFGHPDSYPDIPIAMKIFMANLMAIGSMWPKKIKN